MTPKDHKKEGGGSLLGMLLIVTASWLLILVMTYVFFVIVRPLGPPLHEGPLPSSVLKILLTAGLGVLWVGVMFAIWRLYLRAHQIPTSAS
jgi:hypothetical protein